MALDRYRAHLDGLNLSDEEKTSLIEITEAIVSNLINNLFMEQAIHDNNQRKTTGS